MLHWALLAKSIPARKLTSSISNAISLKVKLHLVVEMSNQNNSKGVRPLLKILLISLVSLLALLLIIAVGFLLFMAVALSGGTHKEWTKGNINANATIQFAGFGVKYFNVAVGNKTIPIGKDTLFSIEFKNGDRLSSDEITLGKILKLNPKVLDQNELDGSVTRYYCIDEARFSFSGEKLVLFDISRMSVDGKSILKIGDSEMKSFFSLPLTEAQCELLFGKPDKVQSFDGL